jgi:hypothetical protein
MIYFGFELSVPEAFDVIEPQSVPVSTAVPASGARIVRLVAPARMI